MTSSPPYATRIAGARKPARSSWPSTDNHSASLRLALALGPAVAVALLWMCANPIAQPLAYHSFHDARSVLGIPNFLNVISNLPFAMVGLMGLTWSLSPRISLPTHLKACYVAMFLGIASTAIGSAIYHWAPDNASLVWDRLPMSIGFMGLFAGFLAERLRLTARTSLWLLAALLAYGTCSVYYWSAVDDLRLYALAQFYPIVAIPLMIWRITGVYSRERDWLVAIGIYGAAKALEEVDGIVFAAGGLVSGHTLKHLVASAGAYWIYRMLTRRQLQD